MASRASAGLLAQQREGRSLECFCFIFAFLCRGYIAPEVLNGDECVYNFFYSLYVSLCSFSFRHAALLLLQTCTVWVS
jgi:hypothetical protein